MPPAIAAWSAASISEGVSSAAPAGIAIFASVMVHCLRNGWGTHRPHCKRNVRAGENATNRHGKSERSLVELYADDPERADAIAFGRRGALKGASLAAIGAAVGATIPFADRACRQG